ncbi:peptidase S8/S53 domain-containing protein [Xylaria arbuscula]|nr:peptidase S8/S53 domain-containing protein [Xylaria arbuscula]
MSQTRNVRQAPSTSQSTGIVPFTGATTTSNARGARAGPVPTSGSATASSPPAPPPPIKTVDQVDGKALKGVSMNEGAYTVQLKSDSEGVTEAQRNSHMEKIQTLSQKYMADSGTSGTPYAGIETKLVTLLPAYIGQFHPDVVQEIKTSKEVKRVTPNQAFTSLTNGTTTSAVPNTNSDPKPSAPAPGNDNSANYEGCMSWGPSKVTLTEAEFQKIMRVPGLKKPWVRDRSQMGKLGEGVTICVVDEGGFEPWDIEKERLVWTDTGDKTKISYPSAPTKQPVHGTLVASVACGTQCGMAPKADCWVSSPEEGTYASTLLAFEKIARFKSSGYVIMNMSWGIKGWKKDGHTLADALQELIRRNVIVVVAAGQAKEKNMLGREIKKDVDCLEFPQNADGIILVGCTNTQDQRPADTNFGSKVDVYAPGDWIPTGYESGSKFDSGTSFSAPLVSGLLAFLLSSEKWEPGKHFTVQEIREILVKHYSKTTEKTQLPVVTAFMQKDPMTIAPKFSGQVGEAERDALRVSLQGDLYSIVFPLSSEPLPTDQKGVDRLLKVIASRDVDEYKKILSDEMKEKFDAKASWDNMKQFKVVHNGAPGSSLEKRANAICAKVKTLAKDEPKTETIFTFNVVDKRAGHPSERAT